MADESAHTLCNLEHRRSLRLIGQHDHNCVANFTRATSLSIFPSSRFQHKPESKTSGRLCQSRQVGYSLSLNVFIISPWSERADRVSYESARFSRQRYFSYRARRRLSVLEHADIVRLRPLSCPASTRTGRAEKSLSGSR